MSGREPLGSILFLITAVRVWIQYFYLFLSYVVEKLALPSLNKCFKRCLKSFFVHSGVLNIFNYIKHIVVFFFDLVS